MATPSQRLILDRHKRYVIRCHSISSIYLVYRRKLRRCSIPSICSTWLPTSHLWLTLAGSLVYSHAIPSSRNVFIYLLPGIPFNDSTNWRLTIAEQSQAIVGSHLLGLQAGNEPDFYQQCVSL